MPLPGSWLRGTSKLEYVKKLRQQLQWASRRAQQARRIEGLKSKERYDTRVRGLALSPGDLCLVRIVQHKSKHKVADKWSEDIYEVTKQKSPLVYEVRPVLDLDGPSRTLHRNLLLPLAGRVRENAVPGPDFGVVSKRTKAPANHAPSEGNTESDCSINSTGSSLPRRSKRRVRKPERYQAM